MYFFQLTRSDLQFPELYVEMFQLADDAAALVSAAAAVATAASALATTVPSALLTVHPASASTTSISVAHPICDHHGDSVVADLSYSCHSSVADKEFSCMAAAAAAVKQVNRSDCFASAGKEIVNLSEPCIDGIGLMAKDRGGSSQDNNMVSFRRAVDVSSIFVTSSSSNYPSSSSSISHSSSSSSTLSSSFSSSNPCSSTSLSFTSFAPSTTVSASSLVVPGLVNSSGVSPVLGTNYLAPPRSRFSTAAAAMAAGLMPFSCTGASISDGVPSVTSGLFEPQGISSRGRAAAPGGHLPFTFNFIFPLPPS
ncbi:unnamed protein product [Protopolystoma xenopodis]|uniref:Uncharacterized protein n=1 Tax=Protopolystoma xenopodis TaxID=117903 RepID=A0A448WSW8_9PLAT|nr:unnamed protein product [Protopolystoma xenopodis]